MKAMIVTMVILDFDAIGPEEALQVIEDTRYPNHCISPKVTKIEVADVGEWHDDHPLNLENINKEEWIRKNVFGMEL